MAAPSRLGKVREPMPTAPLGLKRNARQPRQRLREQGGTFSRSDCAPRIDSAPPMSANADGQDDIRESDALRTPCTAGVDSMFNRAGFCFARRPMFLWRP